MPWSSEILYQTTISKKSKEIEAKEHKELLEDKYLLSIYSDASATSKGKGIGVGVAFYKGASLIAQEKVNIGYNQLVYNGELEGITLGLEKAIDLAIALNSTTYAARYKWKTRKQIATPPLTSREVSSAFFQLKLGHCYLRDFLFTRDKVDSKVCPCNYRATQDPTHILLSCTLYKEARIKMQEASKDPLSLAFLLNTSVGIQATIAFIEETRAATQAWHKGNLEN
ncbi:hypothetical protein COCSADRAFT_77869 [Bipolaris sorokiniana ND90Pr]|uniref:RNase H type-1 domain-containing protein n=1 Tax=Cochliobolus sativus (strain ND90Pr / ATCC 201652) TaxID=665912 RepID=M2TNI2_COCSN|nr:uncharacterized protein COCSADRAFT_77869 [Bipolaris sorokiniana ND90Pr]EMD70252.1 hypothetical protein COCSADRAFT_77869 [Bipolaris sorokiniana ND90Pr]